MGEKERGRRTTCTICEQEGHYRTKCPSNHDRTTEGHRHKTLGCLLMFAYVQWFYFQIYLLTFKLMDNNLCT